MKLLDSAEVFPQNIQPKGDILLDFQTNTLLSVLVACRITHFLEEFLNSKKNHLRKLFCTFCKSATCVVTKKVFVWNMLSTKKQHYIDFVPSSLLFHTFAYFVIIWHNLAYLNLAYFHGIGPLGQFGLVIKISVYLFIYMSPQAFLFSVDRVRIFAWNDSSFWCGSVVSSRALKT